MEPLPGRKDTMAELPVAAPTAKLMATKWLKNTEGAVASQRQVSRAPRQAY